MTEQPDESQPIEDTNDGPESGSHADNWSFARPDHELEALVSVANGIGFGMSLTLVTNGGVVSGKLISYKQFWNETADLFAGMHVEDENAAAAVKALADAYRERAAEDESEDADEQPWPPRYIHLKDAWLHDGQKYVKVDRWRGRLAQVVGWSFGESS